MEVDDGPIRTRHRAVLRLFWRRFQVAWSVRFSNFGNGASRWIPTVFSMTVRIGRLNRTRFAIGEKRTPIWPTRSVWPRPQSRSLGRLPAFIRARDWLFISAILTPAGHEVVHHPQPEHQSTVTSGDKGTVIPRTCTGWARPVRNRCAWGPTYWAPGRDR